MLILNQETECNELIKQILSFSLHITYNTDILLLAKVHHDAVQTPVRLRQPETERSSKDNKQVCGSLE